MFMLTTKKKMILFGAAVVAVLIVLIVLLVVFLRPKTTTTGKNTSSLSSVLGQEESSGFDADSTDSAIDSSETSQIQSNAAVNSTVSNKPGKPSNNTSQNGQTSSNKVSSKLNTSSKPSNSKTFSILNDPKFESGFNVLGMNVGDNGAAGKFVYNPLDNVGRQYWNLAQWGTKLSFADKNYTQQKKLGNNKYGLINKNKEFIIDYNTNTLTFKGITSNLYEKPREDGDWFHLLIEQNFRTADTKITDLAKVQVTMSNRLTYFKDNMGTAFNPSKHAAQFLMYFMVTNRDPNSPEQGKYIWFGFPMFDNRMEWNPPSSMLDKGTGSLMVGIGNEVMYKANGKNNCWKNGKVNAGPNVEWSYFSLDVLPMIKNALDTAHKDGYLTRTSLDQLYITGMNLGWEIPGSYDATMEVKDFSVIGTRK